MNQLVAGTYSGSQFVPGGPGEWIRAVVFIGHYNGRPAPKRLGQTPGLNLLPVAEALVTSAAAYLTNWQAYLLHDLEEMINRWRETWSLQRTLYPLYRIFFRELPSATFAPMRAVFEDFLNRRWCGLICQRNRRLSNKTREAHPRLSLKQAAAASGHTRSAIRHMVHEGSLECTETLTPGGRCYRSVGVQDLNHMPISPGEAMTLQVVASRLALPERRVKQLVTASMIQPVVSRARTPSAGRWIFSAAEVEKLRLQRSQPKSKLARAVRDVLRYRRLDENEAGEFVREVVQGELLPAVPTCEPTGVGNVLVDRKQADSWVNARRRGSELTVDQAAKRLRLKQQVAYQLVRSRLLGSSLGESGHVVVTDVDIERFRNEFIAAVALARRLKLSVPTLMRKIEVAPVTGPSIDGARQYFYRIEDLDSTTDG